MLIGMIAAIFVVVADQMSKALVFGYISEKHAAVQVTDFFNLVGAWNTGVSFSMFDNLGGYGVYVLSGFALIVVCVLVYWLIRENSRFMQLALGFVIGGALGNVIDRLRVGAVFDFLDVHVGGHHWPAFNVADSFICIGAFLIVWGGLCGLDAKKPETNQINFQKITVEKEKYDA